jgi:peptide/nickel transport system ATP-binding protein
MTLLSIRDLRVRFQIEKGRWFEAVKGISFEVPENRSVALVGESGSGKSVSAMSILRLLPDNAEVSGSVRFEERDLLAASAEQMRRLRGAEISVIFQEPMTSLNPVFTVGEQIAEVLRLHRPVSARQAWDRAVALLEEVGIPDPALRVRSYPHELSGGQQQRVMIAMAIACEPKLIIADEPTTALDVTIQKQILDLLKKLQERRRMSLLFITHDLGVVADIADEVVVMQSGVIQEQGAVEAVFARPQHPYTRALLACRPRLDVRLKRLPVVADFMRADGPPPPQEERTRGVTPQDPVVLEARGLRKIFTVKDGLFKRREIPAVKEVSFRLHKGKTLGLVGESGSGKTTVGLTLLRLHDATAGEVLFDGKDLLKLSPQELLAYRRRIQIIFQNPYASLNPRFTVGNILLEPMRIHRIGQDDTERIGLAHALLAKVGLSPDAFHKYPHEFSGGQRQRIAIARVLTMKPEVIVCDESVSALDVSVQAQVLNLLQDLQDEYGLSYIFISHDLAVVKYISDEVMVMRNGEVVEMANADQIYRTPQHEYTKRLLGSIPQGLVPGAAARQA